MGKNFWWGNFIFDKRLANKEKNYLNVKKVQLVLSINQLLKTYFMHTTKVLSEKQIIIIFTLNFFKIIKFLFYEFKINSDLCLISIW